MSISILPAKRRVVAAGKAGGTSNMLIYMLTPRDDQQEKQRPALNPMIIEEI